MQRNIVQIRNLIPKLHITDRRNKMFYPASSFCFVVLSSVKRWGAAGSNPTQSKSLCFKTRTHILGQIFKNTYLTWGSKALNRYLPGEEAYVHFQEPHLMPGRGCLRLCTCGDWQTVPRRWWWTRPAPRPPRRSAWRCSRSPCKLQGRGRVSWWGQATPVDAWFTMRGAYWWPSRIQWSCGSGEKWGMGRGRRACTLWSQAGLLETERRKQNQLVRSFVHRPLAEKVSALCFGLLSSRLVSHGNMWNSTQPHKVLELEAVPASAFRVPVTKHRGRATTWQGPE